MNYWERKYPDSATDCFFWYWGNRGKLENACMYRTHNRQQCAGKCADYRNTHTQVMQDFMKEFSRKS